MKYIHVKYNSDGNEIALEGYQDYLQKNGHLLPKGAQELVLPISKNYHWDGDLFRHDAKVIRFYVDEYTEEPLLNIRKVKARLQLQLRTGIFLTLNYQNVRRYFTRKKLTTWPNNVNEHGTVIIDEIRLNENRVIHELICFDSRFYIESDDVLGGMRSDGDFSCTPS